MRGKVPIIAITMGDPCGIGPEVIAKTLTKYTDVNESCVLLLFGSLDVWEDTLRDLRLKPVYGIVNHKNAIEEAITPGSTYFCDLSITEVFSPGEMSAASGSAAMRYLELATDLSISGEIDAIVTGPISKEHINEAGYRYAGHTDYFNKRVGGDEPTMCFYNPEFTIGLVCDHVAIKDIHQHITQNKVFRTISRINGFLNALGSDTPRIGVIGLNPHCGEDGLLGIEEISDIIPAICKATEDGIAVTGPLTPESAFRKAVTGELNGIVAMYHDQGIAPLKILSDIQSVNVSLGLPFIRTSVSHGTAADIAGKGIADETSMMMALDLAIRLAKVNQ